MDKMVTSDVKRILTVSPDTRADDMVLYYHLVAEKGFNDVFPMVFSNPKFRSVNGIPTFACVSRVRRKLQEENEELRPSPEQIAIKKSLEKEYREFFRKPLNDNTQ